MNLLVVVGSRRDQVCSIGSFARAEAAALSPFFKKVEILEPTADGAYPKISSLDGFKPDVILFHAPSLHDRKKPWNALVSAVKVRNAFPSAQFIPVVHEFSEAPAHWRARQVLIALLSSGVVVNSEADQALVSRWKKRVLKTSLGPTLEISTLRNFPAEELQALVASTKAELASDVSLDSSKKWVLHPGLLTAGKGLERLENLASLRESGTALIVIGGLGPKQRDLEFANQSVERLKRAFGENFRWVNSPDDDIFKKWLLASDLVLLPYDAGVSERRSSFLSAMHCGANVATTVGEFSGPLALERSAAHSLDGNWDEGIRKALGESKQAIVERRMKNLRWAESRSWNKRVSDLLAFFKSDSK